MSWRDVFSGRVSRRAGPFLFLAGVCIDAAMVQVRKGVKPERLDVHGLFELGFLLMRVDMRLCIWGLVR